MPPADLVLIAAFAYALAAIAWLVDRRM